MDGEQLLISSLMQQQIMAYSFAFLLFLTLHSNTFTWFVQSHVPHAHQFEFYVFSPMDPTCSLGALLDLLEFIAIMSLG